MTADTSSLSEAATPPRHSNRNTVLTSLGLALFLYILVFMNVGWRQASLFL